MSVYREYYEVHDSKMTNYISCVDFCERAFKNVCVGEVTVQMKMTYSDIGQFPNHKR